MMTVPPGMEAVVIRDGEASDPYRAGDTLTLGARSGLFGSKSAKQEELYLCRKEMPFTVKWGLGGIPAQENGADTAFGASGSLKLSIANARQLVRKVAISQDLLDEKAVGRWLEPLIAGLLRPALRETVQAIGLRAAAQKLDLLAEKSTDALRETLRDAGLKAERLSVDALALR